MCRKCQVRRRWPAWSELLITGIAFYLRVQGLSFQSLWRDEVDSLRFATQPLAGLLHAFVAPGQNGPLYYLLLRPWVGVAGQSEFSLRFFSAVAGTLTVPLVYRLGRRIAPNVPGVGIVSSLLAAVSPYLVWYSQEARMYAAVVCLSLGSLLCLLSALDEGKRHHWASYLAITGATVYLHFVTVLMVPVHLALALILGWRFGSRARLTWLVVTLCLGLLYSPLLVRQLPLLLRPAVSGYDFVPFAQMIVALATNYVSGVLASHAGWMLLCVLALVVAALTLHKKAELRWVGALAVWLAFPVLSLYLITLAHPMFTCRYLVFVLPALILLAGVGWRTLARQSPWLAGVPVAAIVILSLAAVRQQSTFTVKTDMRSATRYVVSNRQPNEAVLFQIPYARFAFQYYSSRTESVGPIASLGNTHRLFLPLVRIIGAAWWIDGLYTNGGMSASDADAIMTRLVAGKAIVWMVASEVALWDDRDLVSGWLSDHGRVTESAEFVGVTVYRYELRAEKSCPPRQAFVMA